MPAITLYFLRADGRTIGGPFSGLSTLARAIARHGRERAMPMAVTAGRWRNITMDEAEALAAMEVR